MGKYSNINAINLSNSTSNALRELNNYSLDDVLSDFNTSSFFNCSAISSFADSLEKIKSDGGLNGSIANLRSKIENLSSAASLIKEYQDCEREIASLRPYLYITVEYTDYYVDSEGNSIPFTNSYETIDQNVQARINSLEKRIESLEREIDSLLS